MKHEIPRPGRAKPPVLIERMDAHIDRWEQAGDRRCIFLQCYRHMTVNMLAAVDANRFHDAHWVSALLHHFADYYFDALDAYDYGTKTTPMIWQHAHDVARNSDAIILQHLFLGINAHINYDLVLAIADMLDPEWHTLSPTERRRRYADHCGVNQIIAETVDTVQDRVVERYTPALDVIDKAMGPLDEWVAARMIARWRNAVWQRAVRLVELDDEQAREAHRRTVEADAMRRARRLHGH